jgi:hypothetical protein
MSKKTYSPEEVRMKVLEKVQEIYKNSSLSKKEDCEEIAEKEVKEHEKEMHEKKKVEKCGTIKKNSKLKDFLDKKKKKKELKKMGAAPAPAPSPAPSSGIPPKKPSLGSQINFPGMTKEEGQMGQKKAVGLTPPQKEGEPPKTPSVSDMPPKPKAATTLKSWMEKRKK